MNRIANPVLGQYVPGDSPLHRSDPRTKILFISVYLPLVLLADSAADLALLSAVALGGTLLSRISPGVLYGMLKPLLFLIALTAFLHLLFARGGGVVWQWGPLALHDAGVKQAAWTAVRFFLMVLTASLLPLTTAPLALTDGLERLLAPLRRLGVPVHELALMMSVTLRFIPTIWEEAEKIKLAQRARGGALDRGSLPRRLKHAAFLLIPLFVSAIRRAEELAMSMESRCWRGGEGRTRLRELRLTRLDAALSALLAGLVAAVWLL
jgi:energy-coupling factor transport system permease protein